MLATITKKQVHEAVSSLIEERIRDQKEVIDNLQEAANSEDKNTAGDKHEVAKAQMQWEVEKANKHMTNLMHMKQLLVKIDPKDAHHVVETGSLVRTDHGFFYISVSVGKVMVNHEPIMCMSGLTPLAQAFMGHKADDVVHFNEIDYLIEAIH
ncbi:MAG: hypothetical protein H6606_09170 [Flavobacteriales bacterium]|nr:hypothetical protein [Flavobacteriales bacterium]